MSKYLQLGAIDINTNTYTIPSNAIKGNNYKCIECDKKVILRKGEIRRPHFAHYTQTNTCNYYDHPNEAQIHKDAKMLMAQLLKDKKQILFTWECTMCMRDSLFMNDDSTIIYKDGDEVFTEYRSKYNKWIADVAVINNNEVRYIVEIKNTHATVTERPEPWFEVDAKELIEGVNQTNEALKKDNEIERKENPSHVDYNYPYRVPCIRSINRYCYGSFCTEEQWIRKIPEYDETLKDNSCIICKKNSPYDYCYFLPRFDWLDEKKMRICYNCLFKDSYEKKLRQLYNSETYICKDLKTEVIERQKETPISENELLLKVPTLISRAGSNNHWNQDTPCVSCARYQYSPVYENKKYYAICKICLADPQSRIDTYKKIEEKHISNEQKCLIKF